jgi:tetratricopeptide (TPR) repeat protein
MNFAADPDTLVALALRDLELRHLVPAEAKVLSVLEAHREHVGAWSALGVILLMKGQPEDAIRIFHSLTVKHPGSAAHWENLGSALRDARRPDEALGAYERAVALAVPGAGTLYNIALVQMERLDFIAAHATLREARKLSPRDAWIRAALAQCCYDLGRFPEAIEAIEDWQSLESLTPVNLAEMALLLIMLGEPRRAQPAVDQLTAHPPEDPRALLTLANIHERMNRLPEARAALDRIKTDLLLAASNPDLVLARGILAQREGHDDEARELLADALSQPLDLPRRHSLLFPLAQSLDALGRYREAFETLIEAHRSQVAYLEIGLGKSPSAGDSAVLGLTHAGIEPEDRARWQDADAPSAAQSPIFVVGFPRSGTTLLEQVLDSHPALMSMDEQPFLNHAVDEVRAQSIAYPAELAKLDDAQRKSLRASYWRRVDKKLQLKPGQRLVDKNPFNMLRLPLIGRLFPNSRVVLVVRHPLDVLVSCFFQHFRAPDLALMCRDLSTLADSYARAFEFYYRQLPLAGIAAHELKYESFVLDPEQEARKLVAFLDLPWDEALISPAQHARTKGFISTPSYTQVIEPVSSKPVGRWRHYEPQLEEARSVLAAYLERWSY